MALNVIDKVNSRLKFLHRQNRFLTPPLRRLLCNELIQPLFDYACTAWFLNLSKRLKLRFQASQNKWIRFYLQLDKRSKIRVEEFLQLNWLNVHDRYLQIIASDILKFQNNQSPSYFDELFCPVGENGFIMFFQQKVKATFPKNKTRESKAYIMWNLILGIILPKNLKSATSVSSFKHYVKEHFLKKLGNIAANIYSYT